MSKSSVPCAFAHFYYRNQLKNSQQKQPLADVPQNRCSQKFLKIHRKALCWSQFLIKLQACNFIKQRLQHRCLPVNFAKLLKTSFSQNSSEPLLLLKSFMVNINNLEVLFYRCSTKKLLKILQISQKEERHMWRVIFELRFHDYSLKFYVRRTPFPVFSFEF